MPDTTKATKSLSRISDSRYNLFRHKKHEKISTLLMLAFLSQSEGNTVVVTMCLRNGFAQSRFPEKWQWTGITFVGLHPRTPI